MFNAFVSLSHSDIRYDATKELRATAHGSKLTRLTNILTQNLPQTSEHFSSAAVI